MFKIKVITETSYNVMFSSHTQSTYHNWIRSDYYTLSQFLFIYKATAQLSDLAHANLTPLGEICVGQI